MKTTLLIIFLLTSGLLNAQNNVSPIIYNTLKGPSSWADVEDWERYGPVIQYIGYPQDFINIYYGNKIAVPLRNHLITPAFREKNNYRNLSKGKISIQVYGKGIIKTIKNKDKNSAIPPCILNYYAVMIKNIDSLPIDISIFRRRPMALEIEEKGGIWKIVKEEDNGMYQIDCSDDSHYFIRPNEIIIVTIPIFPIKGKNQRIRINKTYSNTFKAF